MFPRCLSVLPASQPEEDLVSLRGTKDWYPPWVQRPGWCRDPDPLSDASSGRSKKCDGLVGRHEAFLLYPEHQSSAQSRLSVDVLHGWVLTWVYLQSCHSLSLCFAASFFIFHADFPRVFIWAYHPQGINRTAAAVAASFVE